MALSGVVVAAVRSGVTARLAGGQATAPKVAADLGLDPLPTRLLLDCLRSAGYVAQRSGRYRLTRRGRRWLDPASPLSVAAYVAGRRRLLVLVGRAAGHHADRERHRVRTRRGPTTRTGSRYIAGQRELARLSAAEITKKLPLPRRPRALLDLGGGHGWYSASLCRRYPGLTATVLDLPGSAAVGREIIAAAGLSDRVLFRDGDVTTGGPGRRLRRGALLQPGHHLAPAQAAGLFRRAAPGAQPRRHARRPRRLRRPRPPRGRPTPTCSPCSSTSARAPRCTRRRELDGWLRDAGFAPPRKIRMLRIPGLSLRVASNTRMMPNGCAVPAAAAPCSHRPAGPGELLLAAGARAVRAAGAVRGADRPGRRAVRRALSRPAAGRRRRDRTGPPARGTPAGAGRRRPAAVRRPAGRAGRGGGAARVGAMAAGCPAAAAGRRPR